MFYLGERLDSLIEKDVFVGVEIEFSEAIVIDQYDAQDFNINECGVIRSDISKLARAQSQSEYDAIMKRIGMNPAQYNVTDDMTIEQAFERVRPRQYQSPCELMNYVEHLPYDSAKVDDAYRKALDLQDVKEASTESSDSVSE